jgi:transcriptional regulator with XRE-family HTH domain
MNIDKKEDFEELFERIGLSQSKIAEKLGVPRSYLTRWKKDLKISKRNWEKLEGLAKERSNLPTNIGGKRVSNESNLGSLSAEELVEALEARGWEVTLKRKKK